MTRKEPKFRVEVDNPEIQLKDHLRGSLLSLFGAWLVGSIALKNADIEKTVQDIPDPVEAYNPEDGTAYSFRTAVFKNYAKQTGAKYFGEQASKALTRSLVTGTYEVLQAYCQETAQTALLAKAPWKNMLRVVRNLTSHGRSAVLETWPEDFQKKRDYHRDIQGRHDKRNRCRQVNSDTERVHDSAVGGRL